MKKLLFIPFLLSVANAHECKYSLALDIDLQNSKIIGHSKLVTDHPSMRLLDTQANIVDIKNAKLSIQKNSPFLVTKDSSKPVEIDFTTSFRTINEDVMLLNSWYPKIDITCKYETTIKDSDLVTITEATKVVKQANSTLYIFDKPLDSLTLIGSKKYIKQSKSISNGMNLSTYLYPEDNKLSQKYMQQTQKYFDFYKNLFGFLPFKEFSVVEAPFPAGNAMPTFTLIGKQIIDKDFVLNNSLGHEIAHQWFGNYVYYPYQGNWVEGMTTFYADYLYAKEVNKGVAYRKDLLIKYNSYVNKKNETSLIEFTHKSTPAIDAIGYGKSAFFFYMLEQKIGEESFSKGIKKLFEKYPFKEASYKNLREIFDEVSGQKLFDFFKDWVYKRGALEFKIENTTLNFVKDRYVLEFDLSANMQQGSLPISVCSDEECLSDRINLNQKHQKIELDIEPTKIIVDENYELFRKLDATEVPPVVAKILRGNTLLVIDKADEARFANVKKVFANFKYADEVSFEEIKNKDVLVVGKNNSLLSKVSLPFIMDGDAKIEVFKNPLNDNNVLAVFDMKVLSRTFFYKLKHLGKYSTIVLKDNKTIKSVKESANGMIFKLSNGSFAMKPKREKLGEALANIVNHKVVFIGEMHTNFSSHLNQLKVIKAMYKNNKRLSIGMEMFQRPFQKYLDDFVSGKISEKEMIQKTEYFARWKYDYVLYRPIMLYARKHNIPLVALNIDREITQKVVSQGLDALSKKQKAEIPDSIDFSNAKYKEMIRSIYGMHQSKKFKNFEEFYHAQLLWDESMAMNIVKYLDNKHPRYTMAVLAGNGHVMFGYGIPSRVERRGLKDYSITLNITTPEDGIADYILYPSPITTSKTKKLGVYLESDENLTVLKIVDGSYAKKAKLKIGDKLIAFNKNKLSTKQDLQVELAFVEKTAKITVLRESKKVVLDVNFSNQKKDKK